MFIKLSSTLSISGRRRLIWFHNLLLPLEGLLSPSNVHSTFLFYHYFWLFLFILCVTVIFCQFPINYFPYATHALTPSYFFDCRVNVSFSLFHQRSRNNLVQTSKQGPLKRILFTWAFVSNNTTALFKELFLLWTSSPYVSGALHYYVH